MNEVFKENEIENIKVKKIMKKWIEIGKKVKWDFFLKFYFVILYFIIYEHDE